MAPRPGYAYEAPPPQGFAGPWSSWLRSVEAVDGRLRPGSNTEAPNRGNSPYLPKDWPSPRSEFSHPDVVIVWTCLKYYYRGLTDGELTEPFRHLRSLSKRRSSEYNTWIKNNPHIPAGLRHLTSVNLKDTKQYANGILNHLRHSKTVIDYYLSNVLFTKQMREFPEKLSASPWDLTGQRRHLLTGFGGTSDSREMLPLPVHYLDLQPHTNAAVLDCLLRPENTVGKIDMTAKGKRSAAEFRLDLLSNSSPEIRVILDVGAQVLGMKNLEVAKAWLRRVDEATAEAGRWTGYLMANWSFATMSSSIHIFLLGFL